MKIKKVKCRYCGKEDDPRSMMGVIPVNGESYYHCFPLECRGSDKELNVNPLDLKLKTKE